MKRNWPAIIFRLLAAGCAWILSTVICFAWMVVHAYDGFISLIFQPIAAAVSSALIVGLALLLGLALKIPQVHRLWTWKTATGLGIFGVIVLVIGSIFGPSVQIEDPEGTMQVLDPGVSVPAFFALIFSVANFPRPDSWDDWVTWISQRKPDTEIE